MKVYVVLDNNWQHYEGGGADIVSIFASKELALAKVCALFEEIGEAMEGRENEPDCWYYRETGGADYWYSIESYDVVGE